MVIAYTYNHLHAEDFLYYRKADLINEIEKCINDVDANKYLKMSCANPSICEIYYDQKALNDEIKNRLKLTGWNESKTSYYVTCDEDTTKEIVKISDKDEQKRIIQERGFEPLQSHNQVDFLKDRVAVEVQFGKYFSVAYDLHVKHTFFYLRDDIDVGIEIIPTHRMMTRMDTGVSWFENEVTNVIREGRNNPSVPIYILGIESADVISTKPEDYKDSELREIISHSDKRKLISQMNNIKQQEQEKWENQINNAKRKLDVLENELDKNSNEYLSLTAQGYSLESREIKKLLREKEKLTDKINNAGDKYNEIKKEPPIKLARILRVEKIL